MAQTLLDGIVEYDGRVDEGVGSLGQDRQEMLQVELCGLLGPRARVRSVGVDDGRARLEAGEGVSDELPAAGRDVRIVAHVGRPVQGGFDDHRDGAVSYHGSSISEREVTMMHLARVELPAWHTAS